MKRGEIRRIMGTGISNLSITSLRFERPFVTSGYPRDSDGCLVCGRFSAAAAFDGTSDVKEGSLGWGGASVIPDISLCEHSRYRNKSSAGLLCPPAVRGPSGWLTGEQKR